MARELNNFGAPKILGGSLMIQLLQVAIGAHCVPLRQMLWMQE